MKQTKYDIVVVGGGHAGVEAALISSQMGCSVLLVTMDIKAIGRMSCNPAIGGLAKSHLVKEIDALGGVMPLASDFSAIQYKTLNLSKGPAVHSLRIQTDKKKYPAFIQKLIKRDKNISLLEGEGVAFKTLSGKVSSAFFSGIADDFSSISLCLDNLELYDFCKKNLYFSGSPSSLQHRRVCPDKKVHPS